MPRVRFHPSQADMTYHAGSAMMCGARLIASLNTGCDTIPRPLLAISPTRYKRARKFPPKDEDTHEIPELRIAGGPAARRGRGRSGDRPAGGGRKGAERARRAARGDQRRPLLGEG